MCSHMFINIIGRKFTASIGEPWDFSSSVGENYLEGKIMGFSKELKKRPWFLCEISPFEDNGHKIKQVIIVNRYSNSQNLLECFIKNKPATVACNC